MPSFSANSPSAHSTTRTVLFVVYPQVKLLDLAGPMQAFNDALSENGKQAYRTVVASVNGSLTNTDTSVSLTCESLSDWKRRQIHTLIVVGGKGVFSAIDDDKLKQRISQLATKSKRVGSVCNGAFLLAACGLLDGRRATTHWDCAERLASDYPKVTVKENSIFTTDGSIWSSAGVTAGIDMALAMIAEDLGKSAALGLARSLVTFFVRPGGQSQFSEALDLQTSDSHCRFAELHHWIQSNLDKDLRISQLAAKANMSDRNFARLYLSETGKTPAKAIEALRIEAARRLLEDGSLSIAAIARRCGFGDDERMRRSFIRILKVSPQGYLKGVSAN